MWQSDNLVVERCVYDPEAQSIDVEFTWTGTPEMPYLQGTWIGEHFNIALDFLGSNSYKKTYSLREWTTRANPLQSLAFYGFDPTGLGAGTVLLEIPKEEMVEKPAIPKLEDLMPMPPHMGPPLPRFLVLYWPWYKAKPQA